MYAPTSIVSPGAAALALQNLNDISRIQLDDGSTVQNPLPLPPYLGADATRRVGDTSQGFHGVLSYSDGRYEIQPKGKYFSPGRMTVRVSLRLPRDAESRSDEPLELLHHAEHRRLHLRPSGNLPCRGASTPAEFTRQRDKLITSLTQIDADILGLMEIENNAAIATLNLVNGLNAATSPGNYAFIDTGTIGSDAIKVALIYKPARVTRSAPSPS